MAIKTRLSHLKGSWMYNAWTLSSETTSTTAFTNTDQQVFTVEMPPILYDGSIEPKGAGDTYRKHVACEMLIYYPRTNKDYTKPEGGASANRNRGPGVLQFVNVKELLASFFIHTYFMHERVKNWRERCIGITSMLDVGRGSGGPHMPMFDYDGNVKKKIKKDVAVFQDKYGLGDAWIYRTKKGYHMYFFCDSVSHEIYMQMLSEADCCPGFKKQTMDNTFAVLRVSAKYTRFDIELEYILKSKNTSVVKRPGRKAHLIQELLGMGQECGTHFASMYPQWAQYKEDTKEWRAPPKPRTRRVVKKRSKNPFTPQEISEMKAEVEISDMKAEIMYKSGETEIVYTPPKLYVTPPSLNDNSTEALIEALLPYKTLGENEQS